MLKNLKWLIQAVFTANLIKIVASVSCNYLDFSGATQSLSCITDCCYGSNTAPTIFQACCMLNIYSWIFLIILVIVVLVIIIIGTVCCYLCVCKWKCYKHCKKCKSRSKVANAEASSSSRDKKKSKTNKSKNVDQIEHQANTVNTNRNLRPAHYDNESDDIVVVALPKAPSYIPAIQD